MVFCDECNIYLRDAFNLRRHKQRQHGGGVCDIYDSFPKPEADDMDTSEDGFDELEDGSDQAVDGTDIESSEESGENSDDEANDIESEADDDDDDDELLSDILDDVYDQMKEKREDLLSEMVSGGMEESQARLKVRRMLLPTYRKLFRERYRDFLTKLQRHRQHDIYKSVMKSVKDFERDDFDKEEAICAGISKRKHLINRFVPEESDEDTDMGEINNDGTYGNQ